MNIKTLFNKGLLSLTLAQGCAATAVNQHMVNPNTNNPAPVKTAEEKPQQKVEATDQAEDTNMAAHSLDVTASDVFNLAITKAVTNEVNIAAYNLGAAVGTVIKRLSHETEPPKDGTPKTPTHTSMPRL